MGDCCGVAGGGVGVDAFSEAECPRVSQQAAGGVDRGGNGWGGDHVRCAESVWNVDQSPDPLDSDGGRNYRAQVILRGITRESSVTEL